MIVYELEVDPDWGLRCPRDRIVRFLVSVPAGEPAPHPFAALLRLRDRHVKGAEQAILTCDRFRTNDAEVPYCLSMTARLVIELPA